MAIRSGLVYAPKTGPGDRGVQVGFWPGILSWGADAAKPCPYGVALVFPLGAVGFFFDAAIDFHGAAHGV